MKTKIITTSLILASSLAATAAISLNYTNTALASNIEITESTGVFDTTGWVNSSNLTNTNIAGTGVDIVSSSSGGLATLPTNRDAVGPADGTDGFLALFDAGMRFADPGGTMIITNMLAYLTAESASKYDVIVYFKSALNVTDPSIQIAESGSLVTYITADKNFAATYGFIEAGTDGSNYVTFSGLTADSTTIDYARGNRDQLITGVQIVPVPEPSSAALLGLAGFALMLRRRK